MKYSIILKNIFRLFILIGIIISIVNFLDFKSLWIDEARLALNLVDRSYMELLQPLDYEQVAPIGFLFVEKLFSSMFGYVDWSMRIFPMLSFFASIYIAYRLAYQIVKEQNIALFSAAFYSLTYMIIRYSSEVKQYMIDVTICMLILFLTLKVVENFTKKNLWIYAIVGMVLIWFSNVAVILLFTSGLYFMYRTYKGNQSYVRTMMVIATWLVSFVIYYIFFIYNHPTEDYMLAYWENRNMFLPKDVFSMEFYEGLMRSKDELFKILPWVHAYLWLYVLVMVLGAYYLSIKKDKVLFLLIFPMLLHLFLAYMKMYPITQRLVLYLYPLLIMLLVSGIYFIYTQFRGRYKRIFLTLLVLPLMLGVFTFKVFRFPIRKEEMKSSLSYLKENMHDGDKIYLYSGGYPAFTFYKNLYFDNLDESKVIYGKVYVDNWHAHQKDIEKIKTPVWIIFSHINFTRNENGLNEKEYILDLFKKNNFQIIDEQSYRGASIHKAVVK